MKPLDLNRINIAAPYTIWREGDELLFKTDNNIIYSISFIATFDSEISMFKENK